MKLSRCISALLFPALVSSQVAAMEMVNLQDFPDWFQDAMKREMNVDKHSTLKIEEFKVEHKIKGKVTLQDKSDGTWY